MVRTLSLKSLSPPRFLSPLASVPDYSFLALHPLSSPFFSLLFTICVVLALLFFRFPAPPARWLRSSDPVGYLQASQGLTSSSPALSCKTLKVSLRPLPFILFPFLSPSRLCTESVFLAPSLRSLSSFPLPPAISSLHFTRLPTILLSFSAQAAFPSLPDGQYWIYPDGVL